MSDTGLMIARFIERDGKREAVVKRDGYGVLFIEYMYNGSVSEVQSFPKYTLNTVEEIAKDYTHNA